MGLQHNQLAYGTNRLLLSQLQSGAAPWTTVRLTANTTYWQGVADYPRPDGAFEDRTTNASLAVEFKPPGQSKREYITGLGQALAYLRSFEYAALIVPANAGDGFEIANYLLELLEESYASDLPIGLFSYAQDPADPSDLKVLLSLRERKIPLNNIPKGIGRNVFWGYWRDLSQYDVLCLLELIDAAANKSFDKVFERFWKKYLTTGKSKTWEGNPRKPKQANAPSHKAERRNDFYSLRHAGLMNDDGSLTEAGYELLHLGKIYGANSVAFEKYLAARILDDGRHLELIFWIEDKQRDIRKADKKMASRFQKALDRELFEAGVIPRLPPGAKTVFLRDEPKLWNKLGLLVPSTGNSYFHPNVGYIFDWRAIVDITGR